MGNKVVVPKKGEQYGDFDLLFVKIAQKVGEWHMIASEVVQCENFSKLAKSRQNQG